MTMRETLETKITAACNPVLLEVVDDSESHRGHGGWREGGETHFNVVVVSEAFAGMSRVARQRMIFDALSEEMASSVHALSLQCRTPEENGA